MTCRSFFTGSRTHNCPHSKPVSVVPCGCPPEQCDSGTLANCQPTPESVPAQPDAPTPSLYALVGCFDLEADDTTEPDTTNGTMDLHCLTYSGTGKCLSGLPFFRNTTALTPHSCSSFCVGKGMDISGIVNSKECRCGASILNAEVWHETEPRPGLQFEAHALTASDSASVCPGVEVYRYTGYFDLGGIPFPLLKSMADAEAYVDSIVAGRWIDPAAEEDQPSPASLVQKKSNPAWQRPCWPSNCGAGRGPWDDRRSTGPTDDPLFEDKFKEYTWVPYYFNSATIPADGGEGSVRRESFEKAVKAWYDKTCVVLYEVSSPPSTGILVDVVDSESCYVAGMGRGSTTLNLGWCKDIQHVGNMIHEIGHALGMKHEQARLDAQQNYHGKGPFLDIKWGSISASWTSQYLPVPDEYVGSDAQGVEDPSSGYAPYDFGSIMHYPGGDNFDTIPAVMEVFVGQRSKLAPSDILQVNDMYQCVLKPGFVIPTPAPASIITVSGACDQQGWSMNGDYKSMGATASGATWYHMPGGINLYFDPSCDGTASARWVLDNDQPAEDLDEDLDSDGGCTYWGKVDEPSTHLSYPTSADWRLYCPSTGGWQTVHVTIGPWVAPDPTPAPPPPPPTPAPTFPDCQGSPDTWDAGFGGCSTYASGQSNDAFCKTDHKFDLYASQVCEECGECVKVPTPAATPAPLPACTGDPATFDVGYGPCDSYAVSNFDYCDLDGASPVCSECGKCSIDGSATSATSASGLPTCAGDSQTWYAGWGKCDTYGKGKSNHDYCDMDVDNSDTVNKGLSASGCCAECEKCAGASLLQNVATSLLASLSATFMGDTARCGDLIGEPLSEYTFEECMVECKSTHGCGHFSYRALQAGGNAPGVCRLSKACKSIEEVGNWYTYKMN